MTLTKRKFGMVVGVSIASLALVWPASPVHNKDAAWDQIAAAKYLDGRQE